MKTFFEKLNEGYYNGPSTHASHPRAPKLTTTNPTKQELAEYEALYECYQTRFAEYQMLKETEKTEIKIREEQFKYDLIHTYIDPDCISKYPNVLYAVYNVAWNYGHAEGYTNVADIFANMLPILKEVKKCLNA